MTPDPLQPVGRTARGLKIALVAVGVLIAMLCLFRGRKPVPPPSPERATPVTTIVAAATPYEDTTYLPARVEAQFDADLAVEKGGVVTEILVEKGAKVEAGQVLMKQDDATWKNVAERAEIEFREADKAMQRWEELKKAGAVSASDYDAIKARYDNAKVGLADARDQLDKCSLRSPAPGVIADRYLEVGEHAGEGAPAFRLVDADRVKLAMDVPERKISAVEAGAALAFTLEALPGRAFEGRVTFVAPAANVENNAFRVELTAANPDGAIRPGMIARATLAAKSSETAVVLPLAAVLPRKGEHIVFLLENGKASRRIVRLREIRDQYAVLASGVKDGDRVILEGNRTLADGMPVTVAGETAEPPPAAAE